MGLVFSRRVGTDPYYANYEKAFERLEKESSRVVVRFNQKGPCPLRQWTLVASSKLAARSALTGFH